MKASISLAALRQVAPVEDLIVQAAEAGFDAIELAITTDGPLSFDTSEADCRELATRARDAGLTISALAADGFWQVKFASPDPTDRQTASERTIAALDRAGWLGTDAVVILPAALGKPDSPRPRTSYQDAYTRALDALLALRFEAEQRAVHIACKSSFLLSPLDARRFIDCINSPWVGVCLDVPGVMPWSWPQDWINILGHRIIRVYFNDFDTEAPGPGSPVLFGEGRVDRPAIVTALRQIGYEGPATYRGPNEPADAKARLERILS